jgi:hypothetical protein
MFRSIPLAAITLFVGVSGVYSQAEVITAAEYAGMLSAANNIARSTPYRDKMTVEFADSVDGPWERYSYQETEWIAPDRNRNVQFTGNRYETIQIGDSVYKRKAGGPWTRNQRTIPQSTQTVWTIKESSAEYILHRATTEGGNTIVERTFTGGLVRSIDGTVFERFAKSRTWFDTQRRVVKEESITYNHQHKSFHRTTREIEYDPTIRIEAPID